MDNHHENHITSYTTNGKVLVALLFLTFITVAVTGIHFGAFSILVALLIACTKVFIVITYFMHLKYESLVFKLMVGAVFLLYFIIIVITFFDYALR